MQALPNNEALALSRTQLLILLSTVKSISDFQLEIRAAIRVFWRGGERNDFAVSMLNAVQRGYTRAWRAGAAECGIRADELTEDELSALQTKINSQRVYVDSFASFVEANQRSKKGKLGTCFRRADNWVARYEEIRNVAKTYACRNKKLEWILGVAEHCTSCLKLAGQVRRAEFWRDRGIAPRVAGASFLECRGYKCQCRFVVTDKPLSRGRFPLLP